MPFHLFNFLHKYMAQKIPLDKIPETISQMRVCMAEKTRTMENVCSSKINKSLPTSYSISSAYYG